MVMVVMVVVRVVAVVVVQVCIDESTALTKRARKRNGVAFLFLCGGPLVTRFSFS